MKFRLNSFNGCQVTELTRNSIANDQREITPKLYKAELWFLCMTHCLIVLYNCMKFHFNIFNGCQVTERTRNRIAKITPKISKAELWFLCMTHCLIVHYKCIKFQPNSFNSVQLTEPTQNCIYLLYKGDNLKNIYARVMVLVHDTSSQCALQMYEVSLKYLLGYQVIERTRFCDYLCYKGDNLKNTHARVMVLMHDTSSQCALQMYEVSLNYL